MSEYTPTTGEVASAYSYGYRNRSKVSFGKAKDAWDRWLAAHDAEVRADERAKFISDIGPTLTEMLEDAIEIRGDWSDFDGRTYLYKMERWIDSITAACGEENNGT